VAAVAHRPPASALRIALSSLVALSGGGIDSEKSYSGSLTALLT
jgi:hypothetical protein